MPPAEYGYMEGEHLGKPYDLALLARLAAFSRPQIKRIALGALLILASTLLDLAPPYLTRLGIDNYVVRQAQEVDLALAGPELEARLHAAVAQAGQDVLAEAGRFYLPEPAWRALDPRLTAGLRARGAVAEAPWHLAGQGASAEEAAAARPEIFRRVQGRLLIRAADLNTLNPEQLAALRGADAWGLAGLALVFLAAAGTAFALGFVQQMILEKSGQEMMLAIRQRLFSHLLSRSLAYLGGQPVGKLVTRLTNDVQNINELYTSTLVALFQDIFLIAGIVAVLFWLDTRLALVCLGLAPPIGVLAWLFSRLARDAFRDMQGHLGRINARLSETLNGLVVVKLFRAEAQGQTEFDRLNQDYYRAGLRQIKVFSFFMPLTELFASLAVALIIWQGGGLVLSDRLSLGTLVAFLTYMQMFFRPVRDLAEKYNILQSAMASAERIFHLLDNQEALPPAPASSLAQAQAASGPAEVRFAGVTFGYDPARPVVRGVDFTLPPGQTWAVVGPTGAGKTSLVNLMLRFYDPQEGRVLLDGVDLRQLDERAIARRVALVSQEVQLLTGTVRENIVLGRPEATQTRLERALAVSGAGHFVAELEQGLDTPLGEGGRGLSAGQRQLLSLARALAGDPAVLLLDEATSSVDPESERLLQEALPRVMAGRTALVVAHRLTTVRGADNILVMQAGQVVEQGRHDYLMRQGGLYARLVRLQQIKQREG